MPPKKMQNDPRVVAYIRVSTDRQAGEGHSLEAQARRIQAYALAFGLEVVAMETDAGASASSLERPGLQRALQRLEDGEAGSLLVVKLDRLTRSVRDLCDLVDTYFREDYSLMSVSEQIDTRSAAGRMMLNLLTTIGQWEREAIGERTAAVMQHMKASGAFTGGWPPYGYVEVDGQLVEDEEEQAVVRRARELRGFGESLRGIAAHLASVNVFARNGKPFDAKQIARML